MTAVLDENLFDALEAEVAKSANRDKAQKAISAAIAKLVLGKAVKNPKSKEESQGASAFFATLALRMKQIPDESIPTAATDGRNLHYNPDFIVTLSEEELVGVMVHEVMHISNKHHYQRGQRNPSKWNIAIDLAINHLIREAGIPLPKCALYPGEGQFAQLPKGLSGEAYYPLIPDDMSGEGSDPGGCGGIIEADDGSEAAIAKAEAEANVAVAQAHSVAKMRGKVPAFIDRMVEAALEPVVDWRRVLADFITRQAKND